MGYNTPSNATTNTHEPKLIENGSDYCPIPV